MDFSTLLALIQHPIMINWYGSSLALALVTCGTPWDSPLEGTGLPHYASIRKVDVEQVTYSLLTPHLDQAVLKIYPPRFCGDVTIY